MKQKRNKTSFETKELKSTQDLVYFLSHKKANFCLTSFFIPLCNIEIQKRVSFNKFSNKQYK